MNIELVLVFCSGCFSAILTYVLNNKLNLGAVRASALVGCLAGGFVLLFPHVLSDYLTHTLPLVFFGASFIGMVSSEVLSNYFLIALSGGIFTCLFLNSSRLFHGFGGGLGIAACVALLITLAIPVIVNKVRSKTK